MCFELLKPVYIMCNNMRVSWLLAPGGVRWLGAALVVLVYENAPGVGARAAILGGGKQEPFVYFGKEYLVIILIIFGYFWNNIWLLF